MALYYKRCLMWVITCFIAFIIITILYSQDTNIQVTKNILYGRADLHSVIGRHFGKESKDSPVFSDQGQSSEVTTDPGPVKLIILTYMRSGSSFTGDLIQQHPDVFYVYEPLHSTYRIYNGRLSVSRLTYLDGGTRGPPKSEEELSTRYTELLTSYLNCQLRDINIEALQQYHMLRSLTTEGFYRCVKNESSTTESCLEPMHHTCQRSKVRAVKVIRLKMADAGSLIKVDPSVKVIHLLRDPRGTFRSKVLVTLNSGLSPEDMAKDICGHEARDIGESLYLSEKFPGRILTVRYEDLVDAPVESTLQLYKFLGLMLTPDIKAYIWNITFGGHPDDCNICTTRTNATETAYRWRQEMPFEQIDLIQQHCEDILGVMGYRTFHTESELRDMRIPSNFDAYSPKLMKVEPPKLVT